MAKLSIRNNEIKKQLIKKKIKKKKKQTRINRTT